MLKYALKEWAVICEALSQGRQALLLRKGGIAERQGRFEAEHHRFWLFPTYVHQQANGIQEGAEGLLEKVEQSRPAEGRLRLQYYAEVLEARQCQNLEEVLKLPSYHIWSEETVRSRFAYRQPGLYLLVLQVHAMAAPWEVTDDPDYAGCRSWVELKEELSTEGSAPVQPQQSIAELLREG